MPKLLILHEKRQFVPEQQKERVIVPLRTFYVRDVTKDYHTKYGMIRARDLHKKDGSTITSSTGHECTLFTSVFSDDIKRLRRLPQSMITKDIGYILAYTGVGKKSVCVDAGVGNGVLTAQLANVCKKVVGYDTVPAHIENARNNLVLLGIKNVTLKQGSVYEPIKEKHVDLVTLDVPEPWNALETAYGSLQIGGFIVTYSPSITQVKRTVEKIQELAGLLFVKTIEVIERGWHIKGESVRPANVEIGHTAFLTFIRKIR